ncbi:MAG: hypothetical protein UT50_C0015G0013 [Candidatus Moranbacteria bacterium GW2011_GWA2_39_41]|nr:MAG: hypothetical protein UT50_C0015G0013 [Candidatus Moranbacteria bacterium GW2011_GWA2_39_41]
MKNKNHKGFSLVEVLMATFVFAVIMVGVAGTFSSSMFGYRNAKNVQKDLEQAQFAMNLMAKTIRTSSVSNFSSNNDLKSYDYSQGKCIEYEFDNTNKILKYGTSGAVSLDDCSFDVNNDPVAENINSLKFSFIPSSAATGSTPAVVGKVTISIEVGSGNDKTNLQTSVSLLDYTVSGL